MTVEPRTIAAWSFDGTELWRETIAWSGSDRSSPRLVVTREGHVWVSRDHELVRLDKAEVVEVDGPIAEFTILPDGFLLALLGRKGENEPERTGRSTTPPRDDAPVRDGRTVEQRPCT